nr:hypothetical protein [Bacillus pumilus]
MKRNGGLKGDEIMGKRGVELRFEKKLGGEDGGRILIVDDERGIEERLEK